jgi:hypothetical protein
MKSRKPKRSSAASRELPYKPADPAMSAGEPPLVIREQDFLDALASPDVQQTLARVREAREAGVFGRPED